AEAQEDLLAGAADADHQGWADRLALFELGRKAGLQKLVQAHGKYLAVSRASGGPALEQEEQAGDQPQDPQEDGDPLHPGVEEAKFQEQIGREEKPSEAVEEEQVPEEGLAEVVSVVMEEEGVDDLVKDEPDQDQDQDDPGPTEQNVVRLFVDGGAVLGGEGASKQGRQQTEEPLKLGPPANLRLW